MSEAIQHAAERPNPIEQEVDEAIRICGGDARSAVRGLILGQRLIEREVSAGYVRRNLR